MGQKAVLLWFRKELRPKGYLEEIVIWKIPVSTEFPEGVKYRLALVHPTEQRVAVLFANHKPKGHHQYLKNGQEIRYDFISLEQLNRDFRSAVSKILEEE